MPYLELAESGNNTPNLNNMETLNYIQIPDPNNKAKPVFVREDFFDHFNDNEFSKILRFVAPFNNATYLTQLTMRRRDRVGQLSESILLSDFDLGNILGGLVQGVASFVPGGSLVTGAVSGLVNATGSNSTSTQPVVATNVNNAVITGTANPPSGYHVQAYVNGQYVYAPDDQPYVPPTTVYADQATQATRGRDTSTQGGQSFTQTIQGTGIVAPTSKSTLLPSALPTGTFAPIINPEQKSSVFMMLDSIPKPVKYIAGGLLALTLYKKFAK